jgi:exopolysaccharide biosynthesis polyprenyl glycosylphosphotransferase
LTRNTEAKRLTRRAVGRRTVGDSAELRARARALTAEISPVWEVVAPASIPLSAGTSALLRRDAILRRALALADASAAYLALYFAILVVGGGDERLKPAAVLIGPFVVLVNKIIGLYDRDQHLLRKTTIDEMPSILQLSIFYALSVWFAEVLLLHGWLARPEVFGLAVGAFVFITVGRLIVRATVLAVTEAERCVVLGNAEDGARLAEKLAGSPAVNATVIGRVALRANESPSSGGAPKLGGVESLPRVISEHAVERVIIAPDDHDQEEILHAIRLIKALGIKVSVLPRLLEVVGSSSTFDDVDGITLLGVRPYGLSKSSELLKRLMDIFGGGIVFVLLAPLLVGLAIAIKLDSRGPVFFRQQRIGRRGALFSMLKFRSMVENADQMQAELRDRNEARGGLFKITDDPRITRMGRFMRCSSLDELPQLLNVLAGNMSLVGPRPLVADEDALIEGWQRRRLSLRPGMTGLWQIFGSSRIPLNEMVKIDYLYGANWSMWLDLKILLRTIPCIIRRRGL